MRKTYKGSELGGRIQKAIDASGHSRAEVARRAGIETTRLTYIVHGERPIDDESLEKLAKLLDVPIADWLVGIEPGVEPDTAGQSVEQEEMSAPGGRLSDQQKRLESGREHFIGEHHGELSQREIDFLQRVRISINDHPGFAPTSEQFWWSVVDEFRRHEAERRRAR